MPELTPQQEMQFAKDMQENSQANDPNVLYADYMREEKLRNIIAQLNPELLLTEIEHRIRGERKNSETSDKLSNLATIYSAGDIKTEIEKSEKENPEPVFTYLNETKTIAGFNCKRAEAKFEGMEEVLAVYFTGYCLRYGFCFVGFPVN